MNTQKAVYDEKTISTEALVEDSFDKHDQRSPSDDEEDALERACLTRWCGPIRSGSLRGSTLAMASITFGGGCLAFPYAIAQTGPIIGLILFAIVGACSYYTLKILLDDGVKARIMDYNDLLEYALGKKMVLFSDINNIIMIIGVIMSYQLTVYEFAAELIHTYFGVDMNNLNQIIMRTLCCIVIQIPLSILKNISTLQYASIVGTLALIYSIIVVVAEMPAYLIQYVEEGHKINVFPPITIKWLDSFSTLMFGFASHNGIYQVFTELKRPSVIRYYKVLRRSFIIESVLYLAIAFGGFFSTFNKTPDVFLNRPDLDFFKGYDYFIQFAKVTLFICLHCTMAINYNIMRMSLKTTFFDNKDISFWKDFSIVVVTYIICNVLVFFIDDVTQILGVIGGICTIVICFINPILIHIKLSGKPHTDKENVLAYGIMIFVTVFGTLATIKSLVWSFLPES